MKKVLTASVRNPRTPPYNIVAETASPGYLIERTVIELKEAKDEFDVNAVLQTLRTAICNLALAVVKLESQRGND